MKFVPRELYRVVSATKSKRGIKRLEIKVFSKIETSQGEEVKVSRKSVVYVGHIDVDVVNVAMEPKVKSWNKIK